MYQYINIFNHTVPAYNLFTVIAAMLSIVIAMPALRKTGLSYAKALTLLCAMCVSFLIGARLWNVLVNPYNYIGGMKWYSMRLAGLSLYGGLFGAGISLIVMSYMQKTSVWHLLDTMTFPGGFAFCIARIGCFLNGCCAGKVTSSAFGVEFPDNYNETQFFSEYLSFLMPIKTVHPTQIYELVGALAGLLIILFFVRKGRLKPGSFFLVYAAWFSAVRLAVLPFRALPYSEIIKHRIYPAIYIIIILVTIVLLIYKNSLSLRQNKETE